MDETIFPKVKKEIQDFLYEEEGNIPRNKMLTLGTMVLLLGMIYAQEAFAAHRSHSSHRSHRSHSSHRSGSHRSHNSHSSHSNAHSSHRNTTPRPTRAPTPKPTPRPTPTPTPKPWHSSFSEGSLGGVQTSISGISSGNETYVGSIDMPDVNSLPILNIPQSNSASVTIDAKLPEKIPTPNLLPGSDGK